MLAIFIPCRAIGCIPCIAGGAIRIAELVQGCLVEPSVVASGLARVTIVAIQQCSGIFWANLVGPEPSWYCDGWIRRSTFLVNIAPGLATPYAQVFHRKQASTVVLVPSCTRRSVVVREIRPRRWAPDAHVWRRLFDACAVCRHVLILRALSLVGALVHELCVVITLRVAPIEPGPYLRCKRRGAGHVDPAPAGAAPRILLLWRVHRAAPIVIPAVTRTAIARPKFCQVLL